jgi:group I intron endonuclease
MVEGKVYKITFLNGKSYIGITVQKLSTRISSHIYKAKNGCKFLLYNAMRKYNYMFNVEVIATVNDWDELLQLEKSLIIEYNTKSPSGYNTTDGGRGAGGIKHTTEQRIKFTNSMKNAWAKNSYKVRREMTRKATDAMAKALLDPKTENKRRKKISKTMKEKKIGQGESNGFSKLKIADIVDIKTRIANGERDIFIASRYSVDRKLVNMIRHGKRWASVTLNN